MVSHFQYLGRTVQNDCGMDTEVSSRICKSSSAFHSLSHILWCQRKIQTSTKVCILNSVILPTLLYGLENTILLEPHIRRLEYFVIRCFGSSWVSQSGRRSIIPPCTRWQSSREYHQSSHSIVFIFSATSQGCLKTGYLGSVLCVPLLVASFLLKDKRDGRMTLACISIS